MSPKAPEEEVRDEASGFAAYLSFYRQEIAEAVLALSPTEQRTSRIPSGWTPIELPSSWPRPVRQRSPRGEDPQDR